MSDDTIFQKLAAPFPDDLISWRVGSTTKGDEDKKGMALAYIDARDVMRRLDDVCGPTEWQNRYPHVGAKTVCEIGIRIEGEWVWKSDGAGDTDVEEEKGALSSAFKRAAVHWGIGRYLYDMDSPWIKLEKRGQSWVIPKEEKAKLEGSHRNYVRKMQGHGTPGGSANAVARKVAADVAAGDEPGLEIKDPKADPLWDELEQEMFAEASSQHELEAWLAKHKKSGTKYAGKHTDWRRAFHNSAYLPYWNRLKVAA